MHKATSILLIILLSVILNIIIIPPMTSAEPSPSSAPTENSWAEMTPLPAPRSGLGVAVVDGKIYAIGGRIYMHSGDLVGTNEMYDPTTNNWTTKAPMPTPRALFGTVVYEGKIYCIGGEGGGNITEVYDPATDTWETKAPMPSARSDVEVNAAHGKIYVMGGEPDQTLNYAYDPTADNWTVKAPVPNIAGEYNRAETSAASVTFDGKIYWIGIVGFYDDSRGMLILNQVYNPQSDSWSKRASPPNQLPGPLPEMAAVTTGVWAPKRIYVYGPNHTNYVYDPATDKWTFAKRMEPTHSEFGVAVIDDKIYVIGGAYFYTACELNLQFTPFGYGTMAPVVSVVSQQNATYTTSDTLAVSTNKQVNSMAYSLDRGNNVTFSGNITLTGVPVGQHNVTVYAKDAFGNVGASDPINFTVQQEASFPTIKQWWVPIVLAAAIPAILGIAVACLSIYFKRHRQNPA